jgi:hypothetical protein
MRLQIAFSCFVLFNIQLWAQSTDTIETRKSPWHGTKYFMNGRQLMPAETRTLLVSVPESNKELVKARRSFLAAVLFWAGGAGFFVGALIKKDTAGMIAGAAISGISLPFAIRSKRRLSKSVSLYNKHVRRLH